MIPPAPPTHAAPRIITPAHDPETLGSWRYFRSRGPRCAWNSTGTRVLAHRCSTLEHDQDEIEPCEVGLLDPEGQAFTALGATSAWSDADGARLQWLDDSRMIFNSRDDNDRLYATILAIDSAGRGDARTTLDHPIHTVSPTGTHALTISFERICAHRPALAIPALVDPHVANPAPRHSGVCTIDLRRGTREGLITLSDLAHWQESSLGEGRTHFVDDLSYSPSGTRVAVIHRFERADGFMHARLLTIDAAGAQNPRLLFEGRITRHAWLDDDTLVVNAGRDTLEIVLDRETDTTGNSERERAIRFTELHAAGPVVAYRAPSDTLLIVVEGRADAGQPTPLFLLRSAGPDLSSAQAFAIGRFAPPLSEFDPSHLDPEDRVDIADLKASIDPFGTRVCIDTRIADASVIATLDISPVSGCERPEIPASHRPQRALESKGTDIGLLDEARAALAQLFHGADAVGGVA